ncbi:hypothetical protein GPECTOR_348g98 [Gonium pectorale]|uniref:Exoribonuclease phosphorolytic domain-containing protein n=1 Tax=Gonium pectorale TaxID=33097 RepID=A0A150FVL4_GONPE|nr:hypothetical protein GPECTOR_348g98 [Gonium pectorale]|eukprot:KXZ41639.1 hypothetical protein GPECTOR_348g98 [Gonium pectorale]
MPQLASGKAEWLVAPPAETRSTKEQQLQTRLSELESMFRSFKQQQEQRQEQLEDEHRTRQEQLEQLEQQVNEHRTRQEQLEDEHRTRQEQLEKQVNEHCTRQEQLEKQVNEHRTRQEQLEEQVNEHRTSLFYPLCLRQLLLLAAERINKLNGNKNGSGIPQPKSAAPEWALSWHSTQTTADLNTGDIDLIFTTTPGSIGGDGNEAAHGQIKKESQAAADGDALLVDPSWKEEAAAAGSCTVVMNPGREVCCVHKADGVGLTTEQFGRCVRMAGERAVALVADLKKALEAHEVARVQARVRRHGAPVGPGGGGLEGRHVMVLGAVDPAAPAGSAAAGAGKPAGDIDAEMADGGADGSDSEGDDDDDESEEEEVEEKPSAAGGERGGDAETVEAAPGGKGPAPQPRARLSGPLVPKPKAAAAGKRPTPDVGGAGGLAASNKRGKDNVGFDELEAIAAVIAGVPQPGAPEPDLAAAVKPGKGRKAAR